MRFAGHAPTVMASTRLYVEVKAAQHANNVVEGNWVYQAREAKPGANAENVSTSSSPAVGRCCAIWRDSAR